MVRVIAVVASPLADIGEVIEVDPQERQIRHYLEAGVIRLVGGPPRVHDVSGTVSLSSGTE